MLEIETECSQRGGGVAAAAPVAAGLVPLATTAAAVAEAGVSSGSSSSAGPGAGAGGGGGSGGGGDGPRRSRYDRTAL